MTTDIDAMSADTERSNRWCFCGNPIKRHRPGKGWPHTCTTAHRQLLPIAERMNMPPIALLAAIRKQARQSGMNDHTVVAQFIAAEKGPARQ